MAFQLRDIAPDMTASLILLIAALIVFVLDAIGVSARINLIALGLALLTLALIGR